MLLAFAPVKVPSRVVPSRRISVSPQIGMAIAALNIQVTSDNAVLILVNVFICSPFIVITDCSLDKIYQPLMEIA
jgi:hypothetical protein